MGLKVYNHDREPCEAFFEYDGLKEPVHITHFKDRVNEKTTIFHSRRYLDPHLFQVSLDSIHRKQVESSATGRPVQSTDSKSKSLTGQKTLVGAWGFYEEQYHNNWVFFNPNAAIGDNLLKPVNDLYRFGQEQNIEFRTLDLIDDYDRADAFVFFDFPRMDSPYVKKVFATNKPKFLLILESPLIKPDNWLPDNQRLFTKIFTYMDTVIDNKRFIKTSRRKTSSAARLPAANTSSMK